jgi:cell division protein FtsB
MERPRPPEWLDGVEVVERIRPYVPAALIALLIAYFGINALTGDRGLLTHAQRDATLSARTRELQALRSQRAELQTEVRLLADDNLSRDLLEERARTLLGFADHRDYIIRQKN